MLIINDNNTKKYSGSPYHEKNKNNKTVDFIVFIIKNNILIL